MVNLAVKLKTNMKRILKYLTKKEVAIPSEWEFTTIIDYHEREGDGLERRNSEDLKLTDQIPK